MQKERRQGNDQLLSTFVILDVLGAAGAVLVFLGVGAKVFLAWLIGG